MFFRILVWELTHYAYGIAGKYYGEKDQFSKFADIGGHFGSQKEKIQKPKYAHISTTFSFFWSVN